MSRPMRHPAVSLLLAAALALLGGCSSMDTMPCHGTPLPTLMDATALKPVFADLARELCQPACAANADRAACGRETSPRPTLVSDFASLDSYVPGRPGLLMGEMMRAALNAECCRKIVQAEFGKHFKLSEEGLVVLTRNVEEIRRDELASEDLVVGTYSYHGSKLALFARRVDSRTGIVERMATREITYSCDGRRISARLD